MANENENMKEVIKSYRRLQDLKMENREGLSRKNKSYEDKKTGTKRKE